MRYGINHLNSINVGALIGGIVVGLVALAAILLALFYLRRRRRREGPKSSANLDAEPKLEPFFSEESLHHQEPQQHVDVVDASGLATTESLVIDPVSAHPPPPPPPPLTSSRSSGREKSQLYIANPSPSQTANPSVTSLARAGSSNESPSDSSRPQIQQTYSVLTDEQADFVNNLYANNVPAEEIARVIKGMMAGEQEPAMDGYDSLPPPTYSRETGDGESGE